MDVDYSLFQYIHNKTPQKCLAAVKKNAGVIRYIEEQNEEICLEIVKQTTVLWPFIKKRTFRVYITSIVWSIIIFWKNVKDEMKREMYDYMH